MSLMSSNDLFFFLDEHEQAKESFIEPNAVGGGGAGGVGQEFPSEFKAFTYNGDSPLS